MSTTPTPHRDAIVWVAGGRNYQDQARVDHVLSAYDQRHGIRRIVTGAAPGADHLAENWARKVGKPYVGIPARWNELGNAAGPRRNEQIATEEKPDALIVFPGGRGTQNAIEVAERYHIPVYRIQASSAPAPKEDAPAS